MIQNRIQQKLLKSGNNFFGLIKMIIFRKVIVKKSTHLKHGIWAFYHIFRIFLVLYPFLLDPDPYWYYFCLDPDPYQTSSWIRIRNEFFHIWINFLRPWDIADCFLNADPDQHRMRILIWIKENNNRGYMDMRIWIHIL